MNFLLVQTISYSIQCLSSSMIILSTVGFLTPLQEGKSVVRGDVERNILHMCVAKGSPEIFIRARNIQDCDDSLLTVPDIVGAAVCKPDILWSQEAKQGTKPVRASVCVDSGYQQQGGDPVDVDEIGGVARLFCLDGK